MSDEDLVPELADEELEERDDSARRKWWWLVVLLLLLLLFACLALQYFFPGSRKGTSGDETEGITPVFGVYGLMQPLAAASGPSGEIVVSDTGVQKAYVFGNDGTLDYRLGDDAPGSKVFSPQGSLFAGDTIYLCDWGMRRVWIFDTEGRVTGFFPEDPNAEEYGSKGFSPFDIAAFGSELLVTSHEGVYRFAGSNGAYLGRFDKAEVSGKPLDFPNGIAVNSTGDRVFVCDTLNRRVVAYDAQGNPLWRLGKPDVAGEIQSILQLPRGIVVTEKGVLVSDTFSHRLFLLDEEGQLLGTYGRRGVNDGELNFPEGVDVAPDGLVYIADRENNRVQVVRLGEPISPDVQLQEQWRDDYERIRE